MAQKEFIVRYRVDGPRGLRRRLATVLVSIVAVLCKVKVRPVVDTHSESRAAEVEATRRMIRAD